MILRDYFKQDSVRVYFEKEAAKIIPVSKRYFLNQQNCPNERTGFCVILIRVDPAAYWNKHSVTVRAFITPLLMKYEMHVAFLYLSTVVIYVSSLYYREKMRQTIKHFYVV